MKHFFLRLVALSLAAVILAPGAVAAEPVPEAQHYCLMEAATGKILMAAGEHDPLPPASVTKVMTLLLIMEAVDSGQIRFDTPVTASETAAAKGGSQIYLKAGETLTVEDMVKSIAVSSANDCACAMAELLAGSEAAFAEKMNAKAKDLGMKDTHFVNCTGLDDSSDASEHRTSAHDIALMSRELLTSHPDIRKFTTIWMDSVRSGAFGLSNTNKLVRFYPGCTGLKTGFTSAAGYCLSASACRDGMELIAVVLGCKTSRERFAACRRMLDWGFACYTLYEPKLPEIPPVPVTLGKTVAVIPVPRTPLQVLTEKAPPDSLHCETELADALRAPVEAGAEAGSVSLFRGETLLVRIPLVVPEAVPRLGFGDLFVKILSKLAMASALPPN